VASADRSPERRTTGEKRTVTAQWRPGRDRRAVRHPGGAGQMRPAGATPSVVVVGGGIAGIAAAVGLAERGVRVVLVEKQAQLGGRVRSWPVEHAGDRVTMSRGFHAFFRQYYNLRGLIRRVDPALSALVAVADYPLVLAGGATDSFASIPRTPPVNLAAFVARSPSFPLRALREVDIDAALELLDVDFPATHSRYDGKSAEQFLDRLRFPATARHLALEVFARSFFARPGDFSAGELVAMFHSYFVGSSEGLLFDVPTDDYDTVFWAPMRRYLQTLGVEIRVGATVDEIRISGSGVTVRMTQSGTTTETAANALVLATDLAATRRLIAAAADLGDPAWRARIADTRNAPRFAVWRLWLDRPVATERPAFLGTSGFGLLDNITVLERFERGARNWTATRSGSGSVVEVHAYAVPDDLSDAQLQTGLRDQLSQVYPETAAAQVIASEWEINTDCPLIGTGPWLSRPEVTTGDPRVLLAGDGIRCDLPVALMERAATTGFLAANSLLHGWGLAGHDVWSVPMSGRIPGISTLRRLLAYSGYSPRVRSR